MVVSTMKEIFVSIFGKPFGIIIFQLLEATQFTSRYLPFSEVGQLGSSLPCFASIRQKNQRQER